MWMLCNKQGPLQLLAMLPEPSHTRSIRSLRSCHSLQFPLSNSERHLSFFFLYCYSSVEYSTSICSPMQLPCFFSRFSTNLFLPGHVFLWTSASSTLLIHYNFTECPVVFFFSAIIEELPLISLAIGISSLNKFNNNNNNYYITKKTPCGIQITERCLPQPVACTNRLNTLHKRTG